MIKFKGKGVFQGKCPEFSNLGEFVPIIALAESDLRHAQDCVAMDASRM